MSHHISGDSAHCVAEPPRPRIRLAGVVLVVVVGCTGTPTRPPLPTLPACGEGPASLPCLETRRFTESELEAALAGRSEAVWRDADRLCFAGRFRAHDVFLTGGLQTALHRVGDDGYFGACIRVPRLDEAILSYRLCPDFALGRANTLPPRGVYRGPLAPPAEARTEVLRGDCFERSLDSRFLNESRTVSVYRPPGAEALDGVVVLVDGALTAEFASVLEPAIAASRAPRFALVGVHAARSTGVHDGRAAEYLAHLGDRRFELHERFFLEELLPAVPALVGEPRMHCEPVLLGVSNGAAFVLSLLARHPGRFSRAVALSVAGGPPPEQFPGSPSVYLAAGTLEGADEPDDRTRRWARTLERNGARVAHAVRVAGHDSYFWSEELPEALRWLGR